MKPKSKLPLISFLVVSLSASSLFSSADMMKDHTVKLEEVNRFNLKAVLEEFADPHAYRNSFDITGDEKHLVLPIWIRDADGHCRGLPNCGSYALGLVDIASGKLEARTQITASSAPFMTLFVSQTHPEIVTNFGNDLVFLDAYTLSEMHRLSFKDFAPADQERASFVSAALSSDTQRLAAIYYVRQALPTNTNWNSVGTLHLFVFDMVHFTVLSHCVLEEHEQYPPTFTTILTPNAQGLLYAATNRPDGGQSLVKSDLQTCSVVQSWKFDEAPRSAQLSSDGKYLAVVFGGLRPKVKVRVLSTSDGSVLWDIPIHSVNDMKWQMSISADNRWLAISTDRYGESWADTWREGSHVDDPGVEIRDLRNGKMLTKVQFAKSGPFRVGLGLGTRMVRFTPSNKLIVLSFDSIIHVYNLQAGEPPLVLEF